MEKHSEEVLAFVDAFIQACTEKRQELFNQSVKASNLKVAQRLIEMSNDIETYSKKVLLTYVETGKIEIL